MKNKILKIMAVVLVLSFITTSSIYKSSKKMGVDPGKVNYRI
ncbi:MAG: hypothetical protein Q3988_07410 [Gemella sp.]|nr:hypothetical protein [Gemella sp.]